ncbi:MAG: tagaturonate epimerase family protein [Verrucomicrobia bacterium]|nr:tagaturonate epimerase family protein [Verrucomicrobiota bacterium]
MNLHKHTFGMGDRFARQGHAQLEAILKARTLGLSIQPVWNKSNREHLLVGTQPDDLRAEAEAAAGWTDGYYVDADHIGIATVDWFINASNFHTLDVADFIGKPANPADVESFVGEMAKYTGTLAIPGIAAPVAVDDATVRSAACKFLFAIQEAGRIYRHIVGRKGNDHFITELSVDETDLPQRPVELFLILAMIAREGIPAQTIAPKFTGRFNKGVDHVGSIARFEAEFDQDLCVIAHAIREFGLPASLKLSIHSGSDKFSLYPTINRLIKQHAAGLHVKTAGTTWLEEIIGLAESGGEGLEIAKAIYAGAYPKAAELIAPYAPVVDIVIAELPTPAEVAEWSAERFVAALRHDQSDPNYNAQFRQFIHVSFKVAAQMGACYTDALEKFRPGIARNVTHNLLERHLKPLFG